MSLRMAAWFILAASLARVIGGAVLLHYLGAPRWAVAAFLLLTVRFRLLSPREPKPSDPVRVTGRKVRQ